MGTDGIGVLPQVDDQLVQFRGQVVRVIQKQLRPHVLVQPGHPGHVLEAAGGEAPAALGLGGFDIGAGDDVGQLGGEGDDPVMLLGIGEGQPRKAQIQEEGLEGLQQLHVRALVRREDHGGPHIQVLGGGGEAAPLPSGHGMAADVGKAPLPGNGGDGGDHRPLDAAQVYQNGGGGDEGSMGPDPLHRGGGADGHQNKVALGEVFVRQRGVNGAW